MKHTRAGVTMPWLFRHYTKFRAHLKAFKMKFKNFASLAEYILKTLNDTEYPILRKLTAILLVLPFCTTDCERAFSAMNQIKSPERSKSVNSILKALMLARSREGEFGHPEAFKGAKHWFVKEGRKEEIFLQRFCRLNIVRTCQFMIFREISKRFSCIFWN